ncbi:FAD/FMN-containing dehydrogenase [Altererythrobacter epoxidivorans]|uniref:FAD/FMN-containing dehydrogenase n=1 Tax=Altererythrobacter epoxidivorans TaxID=361183 RepID=A0A0M4MAF7_9SPHN|nr:phage BR0599 family protein [Altererythrobacter epoxidivorans]ALE17998.1 FAD/FMN-containing dehydrogenase [Altererythrobacter epoxidivorans]
MSFLGTLASSFKGGGDGRVPLSRGFVSPWALALGSNHGFGRGFEYAEAVRQGYLANPIAQRAVRIVAEGIAGAPLASGDERLEKLVTATSAGQPLIETLAAQLQSAKANLERSFVPLTSPTCRARFCGEQCGLSSRFFEHFLELDLVDLDSNVVDFSVDDPALFLDGMVRFTEGPQTGLSFNIIGVSEEGFLLDKAIAAETKPGMKALIIEGCDHLLATCGNRFDNAANFRGEPFLPGNDLLTRYPTPK